MHCFVAEISQQELGAVRGFLRRAEAIYDENLSAYVKLVIRRPMGKILVGGRSRAPLVLLNRNYPEGLL